MCSFRNAHTPWGLEFTKVGGGGSAFVRPKHLKKCMKLNLNFQWEEGEGGQGFY